MNAHQSAYRANHSTETALLRILNDLLTALDQNKVSALLLLDLSAAFDTIDHHLLLSCLESSFGIKNSALSWFKSYLSDRSQLVLVQSHQSSTMPLGLSLTCLIEVSLCLSRATSQAQCLLV
eukprot:TRINITY_DN9505_c0_g1_i24.p2 TRINITY_DN9505_c0_g1~~TRINITY_DN9505_c0_g1_i24.p2  ORF type:complete len:122 (-),score=5.84 TRINITY_DN9505_c0_g1_i24:1342-1707(-)